MVDTKHTEAIETGINAFDQIVQDIKEIREKQDLRSVLHRRARSAEADIAPEEKLPLFLSTPDEQEWQSDDRSTGAWPTQTWPQVASQQQPQQRTQQQRTQQQETWDQDQAPQADRYQDSRYQDIRFQRIGYEDAPVDDTWLRDALEPDHEHIEPDARPSVFKRVIKTGIAATSLVAVLATLFVLQDHRTLITDASASLASVLPVFSSVEPAAAKPQVTEKIRETPPTPVATVAVMPTREAIASAYQTALQSQPDIRQQPVAQPAPVPAPPPPAPAVRRLDPDELAGLLKRAQGLLDTGDLPGARLLLERAAGAHEAKAAFLLAQTYDPAVLGASDMRSTTPDPEAARSWYRKAAEFGSQEAQQRLAQMN
jgi:hypothetical protein